MFRSVPWFTFCRKLSVTWGSKQIARYIQMSTFVCRCSADRACFWSLVFHPMLQADPHPSVHSAFPAAPLIFLCSTPRWSSCPLQSSICMCFLSFILCSVYFPCLTYTRPLYFPNLLSSWWKGGTSLLPQVFSISTVWKTIWIKQIIL